MATAEPEVIETQIAAPSLVGDPEVDVQVATARRFPRSITMFMRRAQELATLTPEIAASCIYALPRDGKTIEGPSARFAEVMLHAWGNMRAEGKTLGDDGQFVTSRGACWDLEANTAVGYEVRRRITNRRGETYNADMITVTGNAGASIALRNAILKNIPTPFWKPIYNRCRQVVAGDAKTFASRRDDMLHEFAVMGVTEARLCAAMGLKGRADLTLEHMATLTGFYTALKDGDTTIEEAFPETGGLGGAPQPAQRKSQQPSAPVAGPSAAAAPIQAATACGEPPAAASAPEPSSAPPTIGIVTAIEQVGTAWKVTLDTDFKAATRDEAIVRGLQMAKDGGLRVELIARAAKDPKNLPIVTEVRPVEMPA